MEGEELDQALARLGFAEAEGVLGVDVDRQGQVAGLGEVGRQVAQAPVVGGLVFRGAGPAVDLAPGGISPGST